MISDHFRVVLVGVVALCLLGMGLSPVSAATTQPVRIGSTSDCQDVVVLGAQGSGQTYDQNEGFGPEAWLGLESYAAHMEGYKVGYSFVPYTAFPADLESLLHPTTRALFFASIDDGVEETLTFLQARQDKCGEEDEHYVLIGYSQGAMAMHRVLWQLSRATSKYHKLGREILPRIDGILAIADGDKYPHQGGVSYDTAPDEDAGIWWNLVEQRLPKDEWDYWRELAEPPLVKALRKYSATLKVPSKYRPVDAPIPDLSYWPASRFHSVCHAGDIVCNPGSINIPGAMKIHTDSYGRNGDSAIYVRSAATNIAKTSKANIPRPATVLPTVPVRVGQTGEVSFGDRRTIASLEWVSAPISGAELIVPEPTMSTILRWSPTATETANYTIKATFTDGTTELLEGTLQSFPIPERSLSVSNIQSSYVEAMEQFGEPYMSKVTFDVSKSRVSNTTPNRTVYGLEDPAGDAFEYVSGDENEDGRLDSGETWSYVGHMPWHEFDPIGAHDITIVLGANDMTGAGGFTETEFSVTLTR